MVETFDGYRHGPIVALGEYTSDEMDRALFEHGPDPRLNDPNFWREFKASQCRKSTPFDVFIGCLILGGILTGVLLVIIGAAWGLCGLYNWIMVQS